MRSIKHTLQSLQDRRRRRRAKLPWAELEAEATRQGCSPADIFFDWAGRAVKRSADRGHRTPADADSGDGRRTAVTGHPPSPTADQVELSMRRLAGISARNPRSRPR